MLELQDRFDLFVGKITRCGYVPDALPHRLFELASARHCFAVGPTHRMRGEKCQIVGDCAFDPLWLHVGVTILAPGQRHLLPFDRRSIPRRRSKLLYECGAPLADHRPVVVWIASWVELA